MQPTSNDLGAFIDHMISESLLAQTYRFTGRWEPRVSGILSNAADAALHRLRPLLESRLAGDESPITGEAIAGLVGGIADTQRERAQEMLIKMVAYEVNEMLEVLTMNGLAGEMERLDLDDPADREVARRLSGSRTLTQPMADRTLEFIQGVGLIFRTAEKPDQQANYLRKSLERAAGLYRNQLKTIARTTVHAVANRAKRAVSEALS